MNASPGSLDAFERIRSWVAASRFLTFSLLIHAIIILLAGSIVLYRVAEKPPDFQGDTGGLVVDVDAAELPREEPQSPELKQFTQQAPTVAAPVISVVTTTAQVPKWSATTVSDAQIRGIADSIKGSLASSGDGSGKGNGFGAGELGRLKGMRTATIFGKKVTAGKLGVVLDVSYSAHSHLAGAVMEIHKAFDTATLILYPGCGMMDFDGNSGHEIRKYSSITKRDLDKPNKFSSPGMITAALKIEAFEEMTKRPTVRNNLYVSWFDEKDAKVGGKLIGRAQVAFDDLVKRGVDTIYWFADFRDKVDAAVVEKLSSQLANRKIVLHVHNFAGMKINPLVTEWAEKWGAP